MLPRPLPTRSDKNPELFVRNGLNSSIPNSQFPSDREKTNLQLRPETFNTFNHTQFFGPAAVSSDLDSDLFGKVIKAAPPRPAQVAAKITF